MSSRWVPLEQIWNNLMDACAESSQGRKESLLVHLTKLHVFANANSQRHQVWSENYPLPADAGEVN